MPGATQLAEDSDTYGAELVAPLPKRVSLDLKPAEWPVVEDERFEVKAEHARGGLGRVLEASDTRMDRPVAVKELLNADRFAEARFIREALVTARLQHPGIVPVYEVGRWPSGKPFYSMKMVSGLSLAQLIKQKKTLAERLALLPNVIAIADASRLARTRSDGNHGHRRALRRSLTRDPKEVTCRYKKTNVHTRFLKLGDFH